MTISVKILAAITLMIAATPARADNDICQGDAKLDQNPIYKLRLISQKSNTTVTTTARLTIAARLPGMTYTERGAAFKPPAFLAALLHSTGESFVTVVFDVSSTGIAPNHIDVTVFEPKENPETLKVILRGPFGTLGGTTSRPGPQYNDVNVQFVPTSTQLSAVAPGAQLSLEVTEADGTLLESGTFDIADLATMKTLGDAASDDLIKNCEGHP